MGKTTLARKVVEQIGNTSALLELNLGNLQREIGFDSRNQSYSFEHRLKVQEYLMQRIEEIFKINADKQVFCDRSPIDVLAYTLVHVDDKTTQEQFDRIQALFEHCERILKRYVVGCLLVQPGIPLIDNNTTSAKCSAGFIEHLNTLCFGLLNFERWADVPMYYIPRNVTNLDDRVNAVKSSLARSMIRNSEQNRTPEVKTTELHCGQEFFIANGYS